MNDRVQNDLRAEQWHLTFEKGEKRPASLGSGALRFIRTRSSIRRELKRQSTRSKNGDPYGSRESSNGNGGGGSLGKWLREHLGGSSRSNQNATTNFTSKEDENVNERPGSEKSFGKTSYVSQNLYCSLPREQGRHLHNGPRKSNHFNVSKFQDNDRPRSSSVNYHGKFPSADLGTLTRGSPFYGSEGKSLRKRSRDRRRYSLNENHEQGRQRRQRIEEMANSLAHVKEKRVCLKEDMEYEGNVLNGYRAKTMKAREEVNALHIALKKLRRMQADKRFEAGLLVAPTGLQEMGRTMSQLDALKYDVEHVKNELRQYLHPSNNRRNEASP